MSNNTKTILAYLSVCFFWGSTYIAIRIGVRDLPPMLFAGIRLFIAGSIMLIYAKARGFKFPKRIKDISKISLIGLFMLTGGTGLLVTAEQWVDAGVASIVVSCIPLMMVFIEAFILKKRKIGIGGVVGLFMGFGGVVFLSLGSQAAMSVSTKGILVLLGASIFWSVGSVYSKAVHVECALVVSIGIQMLVGGIGNLAIGASLGEISAFKLTLNSSLSIIYLVFFGSIVGYSSYIYVLKMWPISKASTYAYVNPIVAVVLGALILGETITYKVVIALVIILSGVILVQRSKSKDTVYL